MLTLNNVTLTKFDPSKMLTTDKFRSPNFLTLNNFDPQILTNNDIDPNKCLPQKNLAPYKF